MHRRSLLKLLMCVPCAATGTLVPSMVSASDHERLSMKLARALRLIASRDCIAAAAKLERAARNNSPDISLHLRHMDLDERAITIIADTLRSLSADEASLLTSLSFSFNEALGNAGIVTLVPALPDTLTELGLVGCGMGDRAGEALLQWASYATNLNMLCIEDNNLSEPLRERFERLRYAKPGLLLVV